MSRQAMAVKSRVHLGSIEAFVIESVPRKTSVGLMKSVVSKYDWQQKPVFYE
jgi:hypothetical protein